MTTPLLTVFDGNNHCLRAYHSGLKDLRTTDGEPSGMLFNAIRSFTNLQRMFNPTHTLFTFDWGRSTHRLSISPEYKANRSKSSTDGGSEGELDLRPQFEAMEEFLKIVGVPVCKSRGVEADDIIASAVKKFDGQFPIVILSGDHDLKQLVTSTTSMFKQGSLSKTVPDKWTRYDDVVAEFGVTPDRLAEIWALEGDPGDNIIGIPKVGPVTAKKFIHKYGNLSATLSREPKCAGYERQVWANYRMIKLDGDLYECTETLADLEFVMEPPSDQLRDFLSRWEFNSLIDRTLEGTFWQ